ncbi:hypothetical protein CROQUDRAFT_97808 [Cronartium quercuum f. sp. fusiforme G11]|uniref:Uncharacterized protein n=1 Tax=Cronartium quercuum f. sp. fusiforme G11 TaxID=708437 RepID=A0A9P6NDU2_9BASI|nr:hypothetical protein CROQUDRAFT_97808 [Cronartium quercuum f. sp. fusiforme G11]
MLYLVDLGRGAKSANSPRAKADVFPFGPIFSKPSFMNFVYLFVSVWATIRPNHFNQLRSLSDEDDFGTPKGLSMAKSLFSSVQHPKTTSNGTTDSSHTRKRLRISRTHSVATPPELPTLPSPYMQGDHIPLWLLNMTFVKSDEATLQSCQQNCSPDGISSQRPSSPIRPSSPSKMMVIPKLSHSQTNTIDSLQTITLSMTASSSDEWDHNHENCWSHFEYNCRAPHIQPRYFDRDAPRDEHCPDLDLQNSPLILEPIPSTHNTPLLDAFSSANSKHIGPEDQDENPCERKDLSIGFGYEFGNRAFKVDHY